jgi:hypothetical protein
MPEKTKTETPASSAPPTVLVRVVKQPISEDGIIYTKGQTFTVTDERADALGELVVPAAAK